MIICERNPVQSDSGRKRTDRKTEQNYQRRAGEPTFGEAGRHHASRSPGVARGPFSVSASFPPGIDHFLHADLLEASAFCILQLTLLERD